MVVIIYNLIQYKKIKTKRKHKNIVLTLCFSQLVEKPYPGRQVQLSRAGKANAIDVVHVRGHGELCELTANVSASVVGV